MELQVPPKYLAKYLSLNVSYPYIIRAGRSLGKSVTLHHLIKTGYLYSQRSAPMKPLQREPLSWMVASAFDFE